MAENRKKKSYILKKRGCIPAFLLGLCLLFSACGEEAAVQPSEEEPSSLTIEDIVDRNGVVDQDKQNQWLGIDSSEIETSAGEEVPENVILIAALSKDYAALNKIVSGFNQSQDGYKAEIKKYEDRDAILLDLVRGKGCDILVLTPTYLTTLSDKGALEDLTPYFESSGVVSKEDLFAVVWESGMAGGKMSGVLPCFYVNVILVEKDYTHEGGWTLEEYLALIDKYPDVPLSKNVDKDGWFWFINELAELPEVFVDWEKRTCDFESESFIEMIEKLKEYAERCQKVENETNNTPEMLYQRQVQTVQISFGYNKFFSDYKVTRDTFLNSYEMAGTPTQDGEVKYLMASGVSSPTITCSINAASKKKDAAWLYLEYMLGDYQQTIAETSNQAFPARRDLVVKLLNEEIAANPEDSSVRRMDQFTHESIEGRGEFTEEDKERVLYILDHAAPPALLEGRSSDFRDIFLDEIEVFFAGDKTAEDTAHILQNRVLLYLSE